MTTLYTKRDTCRLCGSKNLETVVPLAPMPIATPNFRLSEFSRDDPVYREGVPLDLDLCMDCGHLQVLCVGNPELQYRNYVYTTSLSLGLRRHFEQAADRIVAQVEPAPDSLVVELGSNDGTLLSFFKAKGLRVLGVDPATEIANAATAAGIETLPEFFGRAVAGQVRESHGPASIMIANNMFANIDDLDDLVGGVAELLADDGVFLLETQYGADVIRHNLLDTVYHEHLSYFNIRPLRDYLARFGLETIGVELLDTKGGSFRLAAQRQGAARPVGPEVAALIAQEEAEGHYDLDLYRTYSNRLTALREALVERVDAARGRGRAVAGYGVSVGTTALLPQFGLAGKIDFLVDDDPDKETAMTGPGYDIPVLPPEAIYEREPELIVVFAWRYAEPIMAKHQRYRDAGGVFAIPLPDLSLV